MDEPKPEANPSRAKSRGPKWPIWVGLFVLVGSILTAWSAFYVSFWG